jgi:peptide-methionine (R)-S-oxide reductase
MTIRPAKTLGLAAVLLCGGLVAAASLWPRQPARQHAARAPEKSTMKPNETEVETVAPGSQRRSDEEWRETLTPEQYRVTRKQGTERAFTGEYWDHFEDGVYKCVACGTPLFDSGQKFESSCGWPSYSQAINEGNIGTTSDYSHFMLRTEVHCNGCDAHLGHIFDDGPPPSGQRYCINSASIKFEPREKK